MFYGDIIAYWGYMYRAEYAFAIFVLFLLGFNVMCLSVICEAI